jgi:hypothetical protein
MDKMNTSNASNDSSNSLFYFLFNVVLVGIVVYFIIYLTGIKLYTVAKYGIGIAILLIALSILYMILKRLMSSSGWGSLILKTLFYIPCLFTDGINYLIKDFKATSSDTINLLFIETVLIIIYFVAIPLIQHTIHENGVVLLENPVPLNKSTRIDSELYKSKSYKREDPISKKTTNDSPIRKTYSLSMWVYLNVQPFSQMSYLKESTIFSYSYTNGSGHPKITYKNNNQGLDSYVFYLSPSTKYTLSLPHQKWNNIVVNYRDGYVDLFINSKLETTIELINAPIYTDNDIITVGEKSGERNGLYGAICNVCYYKNIMTEGQIINNYNLLSVMNPPVY